MLTARFLRAEWFEFRPEFKIWLAVNRKPIVRGTDNATWRRIRLIPFTVTIPDDKQDKKLKEELLGELPGILHWAVEGCIEWFRNGLGTPEEVRQATESYRAEMDVLASFLSDCCVVNPLAKVAARELYSRYLEWCESSGERLLSQRIFGTRLAERGFERKRAGANGAYVWYGIGLLNELNHTEPYSGIKKVVLSYIAKPQARFRKVQLVQLSIPPNGTMRIPNGRRGKSEG